MTKLSLPQVYQRVQICWFWQIRTGGFSRHRALPPVRKVIPWPAVGTGLSPAGAEQRLASEDAFLSPNLAASPVAVSPSFPADRRGSDASGAAPGASHCATEMWHTAWEQPHWQGWDSGSSKSILELLSWARDDWFDCIEPNPHSWALCQGLVPGLLRGRFGSSNCTMPLLRHWLFDWTSARFWKGSCPKSIFGKNQKKKGKKTEERKANPRSLSPPQFLSQAETHRHAQRENNFRLLEASGFQQLLQNENEALENFHRATAGRRSPAPFPPSSRQPSKHDAPPGCRRSRCMSLLRTRLLQFNRHRSWEREGGTRGLAGWWSQWTDRSDVSLQDAIRPAWTSPADTWARPEQDELGRRYCCAGSVHIHGKQP